MNAWLKELWCLCRQEKKWLLIPLVLVVVLGLAAMLLFASNSGISWALYPSK